MAILTLNEFASEARAKAGFSGLKGRIDETRAFSKTTAKTSIFLSHSHLDKAQVEQAKIFFETLGISIYVDWADETMPERTDETTANKIKHKIIVGNDKFILLGTNNAVASKWCNWEVGISDPFKLPNKKMAILPLADNSRTWNGNEYLKIYPRIEKNDLQYGGTAFFVWYPDGSYELLSTWLAR